MVAVPAGAAVGWLERPRLSVTLGHCASVRKVQVGEEHRSFAVAQVEVGKSAWTLSGKN